MTEKLSVEDTIQMAENINEIQKKCNHPFASFLGGRCQVCGDPMDIIIKELQQENDKLRKALHTMCNNIKDENENCMEGCIYMDICQRQ